MDVRALAAALLCCSALGLSSCSGTEAESTLIPSGTADKIALLVGIDRYARSGGGAALPDLEGCVADVERMRRTLVERFGFAAQDIVVLTDERATHSAIVDAFRRGLIERARAGTEAVFYFAGHGSHAKDASGSAHERGPDETLLAYDSRARGDEVPFDVTDDELASLLRALCARTPRVTAITDSCHSGDVTRGSARTGARRGVRAAGDAKAPVDPARVREVLGDVPFADDDAPFAQGWVHLAACRSDQVAGEERFDLGDGRSTASGLLTWFLVDRLRQATPGTTWERVAIEVDARLATHRRYFRQQPQLAGPAQREVFGGGFRPPLPGFSARARDGALEVDAGRLQLLAPGAALRVTDLGGATIGDARVTAAFDTRSEATWDGAPPRLAPGALLRAEVVEMALQDPVLIVRVAAGEQGDAAAAAIARPGVTVVREADAVAHCAVAIGEDGAPELRHDDGEAIVRARPSEKHDLAALRAAVEDEVRYRALMALADAQCEFTPRVTVTAPNEAQMKALKAEHEDSVDHAAAALPDAACHAFAIRGDDVVLFSVEPLGQKVPMYVTVISISEDHSVWVVYPDPKASEESNRLAPGQGIAAELIPVVFEVPEGWPAGRRLRDRYLVIATRERVDLRPLEREGAPLAQRAKDCAATLRGGGVTLPPVLRQALTGEATRGDPRDPATLVGIAALDLLVERAP